MDGHSHTLSFIGGALGVKMIPLGVDDFGQSGSRGELYEAYEIGVSSIMRAVEQVLGS
jgi:pyruvate dehydrogenase E1 component